MEHRPDLAVLRGAVPADLCATWLAAIDGAADASLVLGEVDGLDVHDVWSSLAAPVRAWCTAALGAAVAIDVDQCWVRRQRAPAIAPVTAPAVHHPHSWHQDGALRFDFLATAGHAPPAEALLRMVTCWIALTACGTDAPGLELVTAPLDRMLTPIELGDDAVDALWPEAPRLRPVMAPGDAVVFTGHVLHRTHVATTMSQSRTSIELRYFPADELPARLHGDRFVVVTA